MTELQYIQRIEELQEHIVKLEEEYDQLQMEYMDLERYCEKLEQGE